MNHLIAFVQLWIAPIGRCVWRYAGHQYGHIKVHSSFHVESKAALFVGRQSYSHETVLEYLQELQRRDKIE